LVGFLHIHTLHLTTFLNKKRGKNKNVKKMKNDLNKNVKNIYYIYEK